jgi:polysaccharide deacetylase family protein (PEP-CTERM system associated)
MNDLFLTIDVEDWFQVENLKSVISFTDWVSYKERVSDNVKILLEFLDEYDTKATFFILGWQAERNLSLVKAIHLKGHEIASHGYSHKLISLQTPKEFEKDIIKSKAVLEEITGQRVLGYRAPSFSVTEWSIEIIKEAGFTYDSSYCPASLSLNPRYGVLKLKHHCKSSHIFRFPNGLWEFPVGVLSFLGKSLPWGGGAYFRIIPYPLFKAGLRKIQNNDFNGYVFYLHPWEIDLGIPRIKGVRWDYRFRNYYGINKTMNKLRRLLREFKLKPIKDSLQY